MNEVQPHITWMTLQDNDEWCNKVQTVSVHLCKVQKHEKLSSLRIYTFVNY